eukprot:4511795-Pyramimonas_sp.AAC.1
MLTACSAHGARRVSRRRFYIVARASARGRRQFSLCCTYSVSGALAASFWDPPQSALCFSRKGRRPRVLFSDGNLCRCLN